MKTTSLIINRILLINCCIYSLFAQAQKQYQLQTVAFYNLENLFDTIDHPDKLDELSPILELKSTKGEVYKDKLTKLSTVLTQIGTSKNTMPPCIIGVVEVENKQVLQDLLNTPPINNFPYESIHYDSPDERGIDVALLYHSNIYKPVFNENIEVKVYQNHQRIQTRDILHSVGYLANQKIHVLVNHWPSRRGGLKKSNPLRAQVAYQLKHIVEHIYQEDLNANIIVMGDFNDNPNDKSIQKTLQTTAIKKNTTIDNLYNPFENMFKKGHHTLIYRNDFFLFDQILFSKHLLATNGNYRGFRFYKAGIFNPPFMTVASGKYKGSPKRSFGGGNYLGGYSDHYPVYCYLIKENNTN